MPAGGIPLAGGDLPVGSAEDILREFPEEHQGPAVAPVRDAFCEAFASGVREYQRRSARAAAQADPLRATGIYLDLHGDDRDVKRHTGELDEPYRARLFSTPDVVTPEALLAGINAVLATVTTKKAQLVEPELDGWFVHSDVASIWDSFIGTSPNYLDRLYVANAASNDGVFVDGGDPGACIPMFGDHGRCFFLRIPSVDGVDGVTFTPVTDGTDGLFFFDGTEAPGLAQHFFQDAVSADELYAAIVDFVNRFKGQGITWSALVDPTL